MTKTETSEFYASKIREGQWGVFYTNAFGHSRGPHFAKVFRTQREARQAAASWNYAEAQIAKEQS